jgi:hypothetical protein
MFLNWKRGYDEDEGLLYRYVPVFVGYQMFLPTLIIGLYGFSYSLEILGGAQLLYAFYLIIARPYFLLSQNVLLVISQLTPLFFTGLLIISNYTTIS